MRRLAFITCAALLAGACKESMHPPPERADEPVLAPVEDKKPAAEEKKAEPAAPPAAPSQPTAASDQGSTVTSSVQLEGNTKKEVTSDGYEVIRASPKADSADVAIKAPEGWKVAQPPDTPDPHHGKFTLAEAVKGLPAKGKLTATIHTSLGALQCDLFDDKAPITVANFVGLARGVRKFWSAKDRAWVARPYYDGTTFHRVIPEFMIQGGDWAGDGSGAMYYTIPDEMHGMKHDRGGLLCMANRGPNTNEAQFFITEQGAAHLDSSYTIFGECAPLDLVKRIARVPQNPANNKPLTPVVIEHVVIERKPAAPSASAPAAKPAEPAVPQGRAVQVPAPGK